MSARLAPVVSALVVAAVVVAVFFAGLDDRHEGPPYAPDSTAPDGAKAMVELLRRFDVEINIRDGMPEAGDGVALLLEAPFDQDGADALVGYARRGATVVVAADAAPLQGLTPEVADVIDPDGAVGPGSCPAPLVGVDRLYGLDHRFIVAEVDRAGSCFGAGRQAALVRRAVGRGEIVAIGGPDVFTNRFLGQGDNAVLVTSLLAGRGPVAFVRPGVAPNGDKTLLELLPAGFYRALIEGAVALGLFGWASARRLGHPVREPMLWPLPGTALARSVGSLYQRSGHHGQAAGWLRRRAHRDLARRYGVAPHASLDELAATVAAARGRPQDAAALVAALEDRPVADQAALAALADAVDHLRREVHHDAP